MRALTHALRRYGGVLCAPRSTVAGLDEARGRFDGLILGALYVFAVGSYGVVEAVAGIAATANLNAFLMLAAAVGRHALTPVVVLVAAEIILGAGRAHRRALALVPLLVTGVLAHELAGLGIGLGIIAPPLTAQVVGGLAGLLLTVHIRSAVVVIVADPENGGRGGA